MSVAVAAFPIVLKFEITAVLIAGINKYGLALTVPLTAFVIVVAPPPAKLTLPETAPARAAAVTRTCTVVAINALPVYDTV